jgi:hypothetical protein
VHPSSRATPHAGVLIRAHYLPEPGKAYQNFCLQYFLIAVLRRPKVKETAVKR